MLELAVNEADMFIPEHHCRSAGTPQAVRHAFCHGHVGKIISGATAIGEKSMVAVMDDAKWVVNLHVPIMKSGGSALQNVGAL